MDVQRLLYTQDQAMWATSGIVLRLLFRALCLSRYEHCFLSDDGINGKTYIVAKQCLYEAGDVFSYEVFKMNMLYALFLKSTLSPVCVTLVCICKNWVSVISLSLVVNNKRAIWA